MTSKRFCVPVASLTLVFVILVAPGRAAEPRAEKKGRTHTILVLDGSYTMTAKAKDATYFDTARKQARQVVHDAPDGTVFTVLLMTHHPEIVVPPTPQADRTAKAIDELRPTQERADLPGTLALIDGLFKKSPEEISRKEVYFFTDLRRGTWSAGKSLAADHKRLQSQARTVLVDVGTDSAANRAVTNLAAVDFPIAAGTETAIIVQLTNSGSEPSEGDVELNIGKPRTGDFANNPEFSTILKKRVKLPPGDTRVTLPVTFAEAGDTLVQVRLSPADALPADDVRWAVLRVGEKVPVLLVEGKSSERALEGSAGMFRLALEPSPDIKGPTRPKVMPAREFADIKAATLRSYDVVVLCDVPSLGEQEVKLLEDHVRRGGGLIVTLGPNVDREKYNRLLYRDGKGLLPGRLGDVQAAGKDGAFSFTADKESFGQPPLHVFAPDFRRSLTDVTTERYVKVEPVRAARTILSFARGKSVVDPAVLEWRPALSEAGPRGRVVLVAGSVNTDWTTWPLSLSYVPFVNELVLHMAASRHRPLAVEAGEALEELLPGTDRKEMTLYTPDGAKHAVFTKAEGEGSILRWTDTRVSGVYRAVSRDPQKELLFAVNVPALAGESAGRMTRDELRKRYPDWEPLVVRDLKDVP